MKKKLFLAALALVSCFRLSAQWTEVTPSLTREYSQMAVLSADTAFIVAETYALSATELWKTVDGGDHWEKIPLHVGNGYSLFFFDGIVFRDATHGFLLTHYFTDTGPSSGYNALLWETNDGGYTWEKADLPQSENKLLYFFGLDFSDSRNGVLTARPPQFRTLIFTTDDGGQTWKEQPSLPGNFEHLKMYPDGTGVMHVTGIPRMVWESRDAGQSWTPVTAAETDDNWSFYRQNIWDMSEFYISPTTKYRESAQMLGNTFNQQNTFEFSTDDGAIWSPRGLKVYNAMLKATISKGNTTWFMFSKEVYRHTFPEVAAEAFGPLGVLKLTPNPVVSGSPVRLLEPRRTTGKAEICILELATGREAYRQSQFSGDGRLVLYTPPHLQKGFYLVQLYYGGDLRAMGKLVIR